MIFATAADEPSIFLMLSEKDVREMRQGHTKVVTPDQVSDLTFNKVIVSLHQSDTHALEILRAAGNRVPELKNPEPGPQQSVCKGCDGLIETVTMFEGKCIVCWATEAKTLRLERN